jgi:putative colanic acid biosynthesis acetyltransferase WcaB
MTAEPIDPPYVRPEPQPRPVAVAPAGPPEPTDDTQGWTVRRWVGQDWSANRGRPDSRVVLAVFRLGQWGFRRWGKPGRLLGLICQMITSVIFSVELPSGLRIGPGLRLYHPHAIVLNPHVVMGPDCTLRQNVTVGNTTSRAGADRGSPVLGAEVELGAGCVVLGPISVGDRVRVGALAVVTKDAPAGAVVVGNPGRVLRIEP